LELGEAAIRAAETAQPFIDARGHRLEIRPPPSPIYLEADPVRLEQILINLLSNAAKYTAPGGLIQVNTGRDGDNAVVRVQDSGIGIRPEDLGRIFDEFTHASRVEGRVQEGLGIGLSLVKGLVKLHGGSVEVFSAGPGLGSEFVVKLPALYMPEAPTRA
jgi:signal transduction histidine kinase